MGKDSKLWEKAYESYEKYKPKSKHNKNKPPQTPKIRLEKEPMLLLEEYRNILDEVKRLTRRRQQIRKQMQSIGYDPAKIDRLTYYDRPILLYVLKLEDGCWYVGMSRNVDRRYKAHLKGKSMWTSLHTPIEIHEVRETGLSSDSEASKLEDELTIEFAIKYGSDKVRGGGYCQKKPGWPREVLYPELSYRIN